MRTSPLRSIGCLAVSLLAIGTARAADVERFLPEDTHMVLSVDVQQLVGTPLFQHYCRGCLEAVQHESAKTQQLLDCFGLDPLKDIQRVTIAQCGQGKDENTVIILHGHFNPAQFRTACKKYVRSGHGNVEAIQDNGYHYWVFPESAVPEHGSVTMGLPEDAKSGKALAIKWQGECPPLCDMLGTLFVAVVDRHTLMLSTSPQAVLHAYGQAGGDVQPAQPDEIHRLIARVHGKPTLWLVGLPTPPEEAESANNSEESEPDFKMESLRGSIRVSSGLDLRFTLEAESKSDARKIMEWVEDKATRFEGVVMMLCGKEETSLSSLVKAFKTIRSGRRIKIEGHIDARLLEELLGMVTLEKVPSESDKPTGQ